MKEKNLQLHVLHCLIKPKKDCRNPFFEPSSDEEHIIVTLDGYAIVPRDEYEALCALAHVLEEEWESNHFEHCGHLPPKSHDGYCHWPYPKELQKLAEVAP